MTATMEFIFRIFIVACGFLAAFTNWYLVWRLRSKVNSMIKLRMIGGGLICFAVAIGTLGVLLGADSIWRLPLIAIALAWVAAGGIGQIVHIHHLRKQGMTYKASSTM